VKTHFTFDQKIEGKKNSTENYCHYFKVLI